MEMDWKALASFGGTIGSALSGMMNYKQAKDLQNRNFRFQERMSNTAYQRAVKDADAAGLNRLLVAGGIGASTPSGGITSASMPDLGNSINEGISNAKQLSMLNTEKEQLKSQTKLNNKQAETEEAKKLNFEQNTALQNAETAARLIENSSLPERIKQEIKEIKSRIELNFAGASAQQMDAISNRMTAKANKMNAETNKEWTPLKVGGAIGTGIISGLGFGKGKGAKKIITKLKR